MGGTMNRYMPFEYFPYDFGIGYGFDVGFTVKYPLINQRLNLISEINFCYRGLGGYTDMGKDIYYIEENDENWIWADYIFDASLSEMAVLISAIVQFTPVKNVPIHLLAGIQLGFPFNNRLAFSYEYTFEGEIVDKGSYKNYVYPDEPDRSLIDLGLAFGIGYMATSNLGFDLRFIFNTNEVYGKGSEVRLMYFTLGVSYFL
jgi:hypothetical protein